MANMEVKMIKIVVFVITSSFLWYAGILNGILAHSEMPFLSSITAGVFLLGLVGVVYLAISALNAIREWQECRA